MLRELVPIAVICGLSAAVAFSPARADAGSCGMTNGTCAVLNSGGKPCTATLDLNSDPGIQTVTAGVCGDSMQFRVDMDPAASGTDVCTNSCDDTDPNDDITCSGLQCGTTGNGCWALKDVTCNDPPECQDLDGTVQTQTCPT